MVTVNVSPLQYGHNEERRSISTISVCVSVGVCATASEKQLSGTVRDTQGALSGHYSYNVFGTAVRIVLGKNSMMGSCGGMR